jgi:hypothetical protein
MMLSEIEIEGVALGTERKTTSGILSTPIVYKGQRLEFQLPGEVSCIFSPSSFDSSARLTTTLGMSEETAKALAELEAAVAAKGSLKQPWHSSIKLKEGFLPALKLKVDLERLQSVDATGKPTTMPPDWRGLRLKAIVSLKSIYRQAVNTGFVWELIAVQNLGALPQKQLTFR